MFCFPWWKGGLLTALLGPASSMNLESRSQAAWVACELAPGGGERSADVCQPDRREALSAALLKVGREVLSGPGLSQVYRLVSHPVSLSFPGGLSPRTSGPGGQCPTRIINNCGTTNKCREGASTPPGLVTGGFAVSCRGPACMLQLADGSALGFSEARYTAGGASV